MDSPFRPIILKKCVCIECSSKVQVLIPLMFDMEKIITFLESKPFKCDDCYLKEKRRCRL